MNTAADPGEPVRPAPTLAYPALYPTTRPHRILMTIDAVGGIWRYGMELAHALKPLNFTVTFVGLGPRPSPSQEAEAARIGELKWLDRPLDWMARDASELRHIPVDIAQLVQALEIDLVHLNLPSQASGLDVQVPVVVTSHSCVATWWETMRGTPLPREWAWQEQLNRQGLRRADAVIAPSGSHADQLHRSYGCLSTLAVVHNGISAFMPHRNKEPFVFAAGRWWDEGKNGVALDAAAADVSWPVHMAGSVSSPVNAAFTAANARLLGEIPHAEVLENVRRAAIVVSPSLYEPFGLAALEGARAGAALALSSIPTYRELWQDSALFFDPREPENLAGVLSKLIADAELRDEMAMRAVARSRRYLPHLQAAAMAEIYTRLLGVPGETAVGEA